jgi:hypothetical protein
MTRSDAIARRQLLKAGLIVAGAPLCPEALFGGRANAEDPKPADDTPIGRRQIVQGLDGMSRVADRGNTFAGGHNAAAVISAAFFCREQELGPDVQKEMLSVMEARLLKSPIYVARPDEKSDPKLAEGLVEDLDAGIGALRSSGHNIIFAATCLKALRQVPEAATPERVGGLRKMVRSFGAGRGPHKDKDPLVDLGDERKFIHFVFEEFLTAIDLNLAGKGHHGFAGHVVTVGHALVELSRMGHTKLARRGLPAYWQFVRQARAGADLGGRKVADGPAQAPTPRDRAYWVERGKHHPGEIVGSHLIKYPYSFYALARDVRDEDLKKRILEKVYHLTATS